MLQEQEPKYDVEDDKIINRHTGEPIPDDEPVMIFRARDKNAALMISYYAKLCEDHEHKRVIKKRLHEFVDFANTHPDRMKEPDTAVIAD